MIMAQHCLFMADIRLGFCARRERLLGQLVSQDRYCFRPLVRQLGFLLNIYVCTPFLQLHMS